MGLETGFRCHHRTLFLARRIARALKGAVQATDDRPSGRSAPEGRRRPLGRSRRPAPTPACALQGEPRTGRTARCEVPQHRPVRGGTIVPRPRPAVGQMAFEGRIDGGSLERSESAIERPFARAQRGAAGRRPPRAEYRVGRPAREARYALPQGRQRRPRSAVGPKKRNKTGQFLERRPFVSSVRAWPAGPSHLGDKHAH
jgi:hypothetical protein